MTKFPSRITKALLKYRSKYTQSRSSSNSTPQFAQTRGFSSPVANGFSSYAASGYKIQNGIRFQDLISRPMFSSGVSGSKLSSPSSFLRVSCRNYTSAGSKSTSVSSCSSDLPKLLFNPLGIRRFSVKTKAFGSKVDGGFARKVTEKPLAAFSRYREAVGLQIEGFLKRNFLVLVGAGGVLVCIFLWRIMFGIANTFVSLSEGMAKYGFLALSSAMVAFAGLYLRARYTVNPDKVYRIAMRELNTSAGILEVMGAPLTGTDLRAYVMSGGGISMKHFRPRLRSKRCFLIFPIQGSEKKGLVSVEVKKKKGQHDMKLLAVDIPMASGPDQRLFLIGDEEEYRVGGGLISMLRDPVLKAMAAAKEFEKLDQIEEEEDAERELMEAEAKQREEREKVEGEKAG